MYIYILKMRKVYIYIASVFLVLLLLWHLSINTNREYLKSEKQIIRDLRNTLSSYLKAFKQEKQTANNVQSYIRKYGKDSKGAREIQKEIDKFGKKFKYETK
jgi:hypothetical protein